ncbi:hypothetical protein BV898_10530 [Hypsibius exemplaris]|uniref:Uncharacterized protein n=1 Tax=Hypsibius exemplaris TaxID=2072580 RepID=A0A1W0WJE8_HYPEX|nr:hypothetical protein BV898_10530 [Hypsibius exemplaris]
MSAPQQHRTEMPSAMDDEGAVGSFASSATQPGLAPIYTQQPGNQLPQEGGCGFSIGENCPCCPANCSFGCC